MFVYIYCLFCNAIRLKWPPPGVMNIDQMLQHDLSYRLRLLDVLDRITQVSLASESMEDVMRGALDLVLEVFNADRAWFLYPCDPDAQSWSVPMERFRPEWPGLFALNTDCQSARNIDHLSASKFDQQNMVFRESSFAS
ncbi:MAG: hypothetical protein HYS19_02825 [Nitrosomonadales bacterium]|nr:hypothetical protein [Nitrosomonadales bacterium]